MTPYHDLYSRWLFFSGSTRSQFCTVVRFDCVTGPKKIKRRPCPGKQRRPLNINININDGAPKSVASTSRRCPPQMKHHLISPLGGERSRRSLRRPGRPCVMARCPDSCIPQRPLVPKGGAKGRLFANATPASAPQRATAEEAQRRSPPTVMPDPFKPKLKNNPRSCTPLSTFFGPSVRRGSPARGLASPNCGPAEQKHFSGRARCFTCGLAVGKNKIKSRVYQARAFCFRPPILNLGTYTHLVPVRYLQQYSSAWFFVEKIVRLLQQNIAFRQIWSIIKGEIKGAKIKGLRISCSGRASKKAGKAKTLAVKYGSTSLNMFYSETDFASKTAYTRFGAIGVKVWVSY